MEALERLRMRLARFASLGGHVDEALQDLDILEAALRPREGEGERVEGWIIRDQPIPAAYMNMDPRYWKRVTVIEHAPEGAEEQKDRLIVQGWPRP